MAFRDRHRQTLKILKWQRSMTIPLLSCIQLLRSVLGVGSSYLAAEHAPASDEGNGSFNPAMEVQLLKVQLEGSEAELAMN